MSINKPSRIIRPNDPQTPVIYSNTPFNRQGSPNAVNYFPVISSNLFSQRDIVFFEVPLHMNMIFKNMRFVGLNSSPIIVTYTFVVNGVDTSLALRIPPNTVQPSIFENTTESVEVQKGDKIVYSVSQLSASGDTAFSSMTIHGLPISI